MADGSGDRQKRKRAKFEEEDIVILDEWDEEFNEQLEEVCILAEHTQLSLNVSKGNTSIGGPSEDRNRSNAACKSEVQCSKDDEDKKRLREALKVKEGEVAILRAQINTAQLARQSDALLHMRNNTDKIEKHKAELEELKKTINALHSELEFKNLEVKDLSEQIKQLEIRSPKVRFIERPAAPSDVEQLFSLSQAITKATKAAKPIEPETDDDEEECFQLPPVTIPRLGDRFSKLVAPEFFQPLEEKSVVLMYDTSPIFSDGLEHLRQDKFKWAGLPTLPSKLSLTYPHVMRLSKNDIKYFEAATKIFEITKEILSLLKEVLNYLCGLRIDIKKEEALVNDTTCGDPLSSKQLLSNRLLKSEDRGIEARRSLAISACVVSVYREVVLQYASKDMLELFRDIVKVIGKIMRPIEFSGVLTGILMYIQALFKVREEKTPIPEESLLIIKSIVEDVIFCRPKLEVLREVIATFAAASHHAVFHNLCRKSPPDSCALYMDSKLNQAIFFTSDACPLKLLQVQIKTLGHLTTNRKALLDVTDQITTWYQYVINYADETPDWLLRENELCCDITESYCHLLTLILSDAKSNLSSRNIIEQAVMELKEATKKNSKKFKCDTLKLLPFTLKSSGVLDVMGKIPREYANWLISEYDAQMSNQDSSAWSKGSSSSD